MGSIWGQVARGPGSKVPVSDPGSQYQIQGLSTRSRVPVPDLGSQVPDVGFRAYSRVTGAREPGFRPNNGYSQVTRLKNGGFPRVIRHLSN